MAKRKTPKAEKVINLVPKPEKITDQELNKLQSTVKTIDHITVDIGNMEIKKYALVKALESVQNDIQEMRNDFIKEYGTDNINIHTFFNENKHLNLINKFFKPTSYYTLNKDKTIEFQGKQVVFNKGDQIIVAYSYKYDETDFFNFLKMYFPSVQMFISDDKSYALALCKK